MSSPLETTPGAGERRYIMITGAAGGLGKAFAVECASRGWDVFLTDLHAAPLHSLAAGLRATYGVQVRVQPADLTEPDGREGLFAALRAQRLTFWGLINVAGLDYEGRFYECTARQIRTILRLNIEGTLEMTHGMLAFRDPRATFRIITVASLAAFYPMPVKATYAASKRFLLDFSLALREEVRRLGVTVTVLCPAGMPTTGECIRAIEAQGLMGQLTTQNTGTAAAQTLDAALAGRAVVIPGAVNRLLHFLGGALPPALVARLVAARWEEAHRRRALHAHPEALPGQPA
ncbi:MAG: SDR family NAD(P)-dependent oxidoreductase [Anaerolineaceae bacterium]|nr:SDR family NAD(P)-dependent oxidoreductase [Anaerolineaceae bacterium]